MASPCFSLAPFCADVRTCASSFEPACGVASLGFDAEVLHLVAVGSASVGAESGNGLKAEFCATAGGGLVPDCGIA